MLFELALVLPLYAIVFWLFFQFRPIIKIKLKKKKLYGPFLWMGFNCLKARATSRRQFTFYHSVPRNVWYSFYQPRKDERLSRPWSHLTEYNFFDEVDTPRKGVENRVKREFFKDLITEGKKLPGKKPWTVELIDQASNEEVEKLHSKYTQKELQHKGEKTAKAMGKHLIKIYSNGVSKVLRIDDMEQLRKDIDDDPIIKDSMADIGALMVSTFGK